MACKCLKIKLKSHGRFGREEEGNRGIKWKKILANYPYSEPPSGFITADGVLESLTQLTYNCNPPSGF